AALWGFRPRRGFWIALGVAFRALATIDSVPALAWHRLLEIRGGARRDERVHHFLIHARLQVARYLPGHAFQVGRHAVTRQQPTARGKVPHSVLGAAATCEAVGMIAGAAGLACLGLGAAFQRDGGLSIGLPNLGDAVPAAVLTWAPWAALALVMLIPWAVARLAGTRLLPGVAAHRPVDSFGVYALYGLYFACHGLAFGLFLTLVHDSGASWAATLFAGAAALPLAWVIGYLTPATPAGAGAVEAVLVAVLGARFGAVEVLVAALGFRFASIAGHGLLALLASWQSHRFSRSRPAEASPSAPTIAPSRAIP
ncbi:MAG: hypothetical protein AAF725_15150, partial [Acidobacteriota bacterium]